MKTAAALLFAWLLPGLMACDGEARADSGSATTRGPSLPPPSSDLPGPAGGRVFPEPSGAPFVQATTEVERLDWPAILVQRRLRVLVVPSPTAFYVDAGQPRGLELELFREFEKQVNASLADGTPFRCVYVPVEQGLLLDALYDGRGDVAAALLTPTPERETQAAFGTPYLSGVSEIVVAAPHVPRPLSPADLAGHTVSVATGSSYESSLRELSGTLVSQGLEPIQIGSPGSALTSEDLLELVAAGVLDYTVCDDYLVEAWQEALPGMVPCPEVALRTDGQVGWATRKDAPELRAVLDDFLAQHKKGSLIGNVLFKRYLAGGQQLLSMDGVAAVLGPYEEPLRRLADKYGFDWRLIAAQVYQESRFDPDARSGSGAIGLMQLLPSTAKDMGFSELRDAEDNLHAGIKYMAWLRENYFDEPGLPEDEQVCFVLAAYNAGVGRVRRWREGAAAQGLDPDRWHDHVEHLALADVGRQPVDYVDTIEKFVIGLSLLLDIDRNVLVEREELGRDG